MAISVKTSGSQTATLTTEHELLATTDAGVYVLSVDTANLVNGETLTLKVKKKVRTGDTVRDCHVAVYKHIQAAPIKISPPIPGPFGATFTLRQDGGTGRAFPWSIEQLDA